MTRPAPEEWNLAVHHHDHDVTNAEFIRTFMSVDFPGGALVARLDAELKQTKKQRIRKVIPATSTINNNGTAEDVILRYFPDLYGYRGHLPEAAPVYYLNPWEFLMWWEVKPLPKPCVHNIGIREKRAVPELTVWVEKPAEGTTGKFQLNPKAVQHFASSKTILFYPEREEGLDLRNIWYMQRRKRPIVPAPVITPLPVGHRDPEKAAKLFSVYLRPWVLDTRWAVPVRVPHLADLNLVRADPAAGAPAGAENENDLHEYLRNFEAAWRAYVRGHVVSRHAKEIIVQFMAACCGKSTRADDDAEDIARQTRTCPPNEVQLARLHTIMDELGEKANTEQQKPQGRAKAKAKASAGDVAVGDSVDDPAAVRSEQMQNALYATAKLWRPESSFRLCSPPACIHHDHQNT